MKKRVNNRRAFIQRVGGAALGALAAPAILRAENARKRPNILYIFTDQQFAGAMSCAGNPYVKTPALDALAAAGTRFTEAYTACPVCSPARASMLTGLYLHEHGVIINDRRIRADRATVSIEHLLTAQGYECAYAGKWHLAKGQILEGDELQQHPYRVLCGMNDTRVSAACAQFLAEQHDRPFLLVASYLNPHDICHWPLRVAGRKSFDAVENPPPLPANFAIPENEPTILRQRYLTERHQSHAKLTPDLWRQYIAAYYRYVEKVDAEIGKVLAALRQTGLAENTLVIFSSDHGDGMGAHQWLQKCSHYEESVRVPFIVSFPGRIRAGAVDTAHLVASCQDFYATALDYAGVEIPAGCSGRSVRSLAEEGSAKHWRDELVSEIWVPGDRQTAWDVTFGRMVRTARYKYAIYNEGERREVLFDMETDRLEMRNLASDPARATALREHRQRLASWCAATNDTTFIPALIA